MAKLQNPFTPGAGHYPPHLAGRKSEVEHCANLFEQKTIMKNIILTGLRGVGKTVLLSAMRPIAIKKGWLWCGTDMSESASISEEALAIRILTDLSVVVSVIPLKGQELPKGFSKPSTKEWRLTYDELLKIFAKSPGLASDKLKATLDIVWQILKSQTIYRGIIFAYDEVQTMQDHAKKDQYPLSLLLDVFQSLQRRGFPFVLFLTGLPTLQLKLVATRTYTERMFETTFLERLSETESREAVEEPMKRLGSPIALTSESIKSIVELSGGYPYFIQFICKEVFDSFIQQHEAKISKPRVPVEEIMRKLDVDFFSGRWANLSDRQQELLQTIATLKNADKEFSVQEIQIKSKGVLEKPFSGSHITQMLGVLADKGIVYRNRHGKYLFAVPMLEQFISRQVESQE